MNAMEDTVDSSQNSKVRDFLIPQINGGSSSISMSPGDVLFILGANGSGKSGLMQHIYGSHDSEKTRWISALRQTFFTHDLQVISSDEKRRTENAIRGRERSLEYRWTDKYASTKPSIVITDLINMERIRNQRMAKCIDDGDGDGAVQYGRDHESPLKIINQLLKQSNIPIALELTSDEKILASKKDSELYSIAQLSDGERSIILIASQILAAPSNTLVLIDEPERHLHQSIVSPLLKSLFARRLDCAFIVATHEVDLPIDNPDSKILLVRDCVYDKKSIMRWDTVAVESRDEIDDEIISDILGARRRLLFVEGKNDSLDKPIYDLIFPEVTVIPKGSSKSVTRAVVGIRDTKHLHRMDAYGIVDRDGRSDDNVKQLRERGIYPLSFYSVESIYYNREIQKKICERLANVPEGEPIARLKKAEDKALAAVNKNIERLARMVAEYRICEMISNGLPDIKKCNLYESHICVAIDTKDAMTEELRRLGESIEKRDLKSIISRYPVRKSPALDRIAEELGFRNRRCYEAAVLTLLKEDQQLIDRVRSWFNPLPELMSDHS